MLSSLSGPSLTYQDLERKFYLIVGVREPSSAIEGNEAGRASYQRLIDTLGEHDEPLPVRRLPLFGIAANPIQPLNSFELERMVQLLPVGRERAG